MQKAGVRVAQPRNKKETWGIKVADAEFWQAFEVTSAAMDFAQFLARLKTEKANGKVSAQAMIEKYAPDMARFLKAQPDDVWNKPINAEIPEWRDSLHTKIAGALVKNDEPVLPGNFRFVRLSFASTRIVTVRQKWPSRNGEVRESATGSSVALANRARQARLSCVLQWL